MNRTLIECSLCPCRFLTQADLNHHMRGFTTDPTDHIRKYIRGMSYPQKLKRRRGRELYDEYLTGRGIKPRPRPKRPKRKTQPLDQKRARYASKVALFQVNYCSSGSPVNRPPRKPPLPGSWLVRRMKEADR